MSIMKITMLGLERSLTPENKSIFDLLLIPEGIDKDSLTDNIVLEGGDFEVLYSDPYMFRAAVGTWSSKHYRTFEKWVDALSIEYNPLENYDRQEDYTDTSNKGEKTTAGNTRTFNNEDKQTINTEDKETINTSDDTENTVSAFDSGVYQPSTKSEVDHSGTDTIGHTGTDTMNHTGTIKDEGSGSLTSNGKEVHSGRIHGNIGTVTSQKMLGDELEIARFNLIQQITDLFLTEFTLMIYD